MSITGSYTIPAAHSFALSLAHGLLQECADKPEALASYLLLLPTRRACRNLQNAFLQLTKGKPLLLPRMQPIGDIDMDALSLYGFGVDDMTMEETTAIPDAMPTMQRQILLAKLISGLRDFTSDQGQNMALAGMLGQLMDEIHTEDLDIRDLPKLVEQKEISRHWEITTSFLEILSENWPHILTGYGLIDAANRRNRLIKSLADSWSKNPPNHPVIIAGSTGSIPATAHLMKAVLGLPQGALILPALGMTLLTDQSQHLWNTIDEGHPQATLKKLITTLEIDKTAIQTWPFLTPTTPQQTARETLAHLFMQPAQYSAHWHKDADDTRDAITPALDNMFRYDCETAQEEATLIAILLREAVEKENKVAALVTPDRNLAARVAAICKRWNINIDDSAGQKLTETPLGQYLQLCAQCLNENLKPSVFLSLLKNNLATGNKFGRNIAEYNLTVQQMEHDLLRGARPEAGIDGLYKRFHDKTTQAKNDKYITPPAPQTLDLLSHLDPVFKPALDLFTKGTHTFATLMVAHIKLAEQLSTLYQDDTLTPIWSGDHGEAAAEFFSSLQQYTTTLPDISGQEYLSIFVQLMQGVTVRPKYGTHPRLMILGQLEARLLQADRVILSGLNEGIWPPDSGHDPWMSRPMRQQFGLPLPERAITLSAHDFVQGFCAKEVFLTRAKRQDGTPTVPARWLERMETCLKALDIDTTPITSGIHPIYAAQIDAADQVTAAQRPAPTPPVSARPKKLSVTSIEKWMKDPYAIYAGKILRLRALDKVEQNMDAKQKGIILHEAFESFTKKYPRHLPPIPTMADDFITMTKEIIADHIHDEKDWQFWQGRLIKIADWYCAHETKWRSETATFNASEIEGEITLDNGLENPFTLSARVDRIDTIHTGHYAVIDYKSGGTYSATSMKNGKQPQLPLEAVILNNNGFNLPDGAKTGYIGYWKITGAYREPAKITAIQKEKDLAQTITHTQDGLMNLIKAFENPDTPYWALPRLDNIPAFNDFEHLERVKEWATLGDDADMTEAA